MEIRVDLPAAVDHNIIGQKHIQMIYKCLQIIDRLRFEVCVEVACVDTSVGTAASYDGDILFQFEADTFFEHLLHGDVARLDLPAVISFSVVCQM